MIVSLKTTQNSPWEMTVHVTSDLVIDHFVKQFRNYNELPLLKD